MIKYYIVPQVGFSAAQDASELSYSNYVPRLSLDGLFGLYKIEESNLPVELSGLTAYDTNNDENLRLELDTAAWTNEPSGQNEINV